MTQRAGGPATTGIGVIITIDGPSGAGKSTVARAVARRLGLRHLDTGAMYRAVTWEALAAGIPLDDAGALGRLAAVIDLHVRTDPDAPGVSVGGTDVSEAIRTRPVDNAVSAVSAVPAVREALVRRQRGIAAAGDIVLEGRDTGSAVIPSATLKVFLTASPETRAERRTRDLGDGRLERTLADLSRRDAFDSTRAASPLTRPDGALEIDSTGLGVAEVVQAVVAALHERVASAAAQPGGPP